MRKLELVTVTEVNTGGVTSTYNQMNLKKEESGNTYQIKTIASNSDYHELPNTLLAARGFNFKFTPTNTINSGSSATTLVSRYTGNSSGNQTERVDVTFFAGKMYFSIYISGAAKSCQSNQTTWNAGQEYDIHWVSDSSTGMKLYVDGIVQTVTHAATNAMPSSTGNIYIGGNIPANIRYMDSKISQISLWSVNRTPAQILSDVTTDLDGTEPNLIAYYELNEGSGTTIDSLPLPSYQATLNTSNAAGITYINASMWDPTVSSITQNDRIDLGTSVEDGVKTTEFWFKVPTTTNGSTPKISMISSYDVSNANRGKQIISIKNGILNWEIFTTGAASSNISSNAGVYFNSNQYYHVALVNAVGVISIYIDGVKQTISTSLIGLQPALKTIAVKTYINGLLNPLSELGDFTIKNLQYWNVARTSSEIAIDKDTYYTTSVIGLKENFHFTNFNGANTTGINGTVGTITTNVGGLTRINNIIRQDFTHTSPIIPISTVKTDEFDLFIGEAINVKTEGVNIDNIANTESGTTNSFRLPTTANNNKLFNFLNLVGSVSNFPYEDNYVRYSEGGVELITNGRLKVNEMSEKGYKVEVLHGKNDFFDKIRGKFLHEAYAPFKTILTEMIHQKTRLCNTVAVRDAEGYCVPLMDLSGVNPIADYQQTVGYYLDFGLNKIADAIGYTYTNNGLDLTDYVFTKGEPPTFDTRATSFVSNRYFSRYEEIVEEKRLIWSHVMTVKGVLNFQQMLMRVISGNGLPNNPDINILVNGVVISTYTLTVDGPQVNTSFNSTPTEYNAGDIIQIYFDATSIGGGASVYLVDAYFKGYYTLGYKVYHENILGEYTQTDFVKNIMQTFNLGVNVNAIANTIELYSLNTVYGDSGIVNDLSKYYHKTVNRIFNSSYGKTNKLKYKYIDNDSNSGSADGIIEANNTNEDKTIIDSELTASLNFTPLTLGAVDALLTTADGYDSQSINARTSNIGDRFNQVIRVATTGADPVNVSYKDKNGTTTTVTSDQSFLTFGGLDWSTLIDTQFNNLRDKVLNRYEKYTVIMNVPLNVINEYDFKEKVYIRELGSNFVVNNITTLKGGLNKWELIKIN